MSHAQKLFNNLRRCKVNESLMYANFFLLIFLESIELAEVLDLVPVVARWLSLVTVAGEGVGEGELLVTSIRPC